MTIDKLNEMVNSINKAAELNEKLALPMLTVKLSKFAKMHPGDQTLGKISNVLDKLSSKQLFITRAELKNLYQTLYTRNTKFAELFGEELGDLGYSANSPKLYERGNEGELDMSGFGDSVLASALDSAFDGSIPLKNYSKEAGIKATKAVASCLDSWNLKASHVEVVDGNANFLVVKAEYHTPKGATSFYIPVEVNNSVISEPELFMGNKGPQDLNYTNIKDYVTTQAGSKLGVKPSEILQVLASAVSNNRSVNEVELAIIKLNSAKRATNEYFAGGITGQSLENAAVSDVELPRTEDSFSFEEKFNSPVGLASINFGNDKVKMGNDLISRELRSFGYKNHRITVANSDSNTIFYGVSIDSGRAAFTVPVKVSSGNIVSPTILLCDGVVSDFSSKSVNKLYMENKVDGRIAAVASPLYSLKPSDLINNIRDAVKEDNFAKAEDALNVLKEAGDVKAYAIGFKVYSSGLAG